jgi:hypothetical protein
MPVSADFQEDGHVVVVTIADPWIGRDLTAIYPMEKPYFDKAKYKVHTLVNLSAAHTVPPGVIATRQGSPHLLHPNRGQVVVIGASNLIRTLAETAMRVVHFKGVRFFDTDAQGWAYLRDLIAKEKNAVATEITEIGEMVAVES